MTTKWKIRILNKVKVTCMSDTHDIGNREYYGCCSGCVYAEGKYGEHWTQDKIWCSCPIPLKKGQTAEIVDYRKFRIT